MHTFHLHCLRCQDATIEVDSGSLYYSNPKSVKLQGCQLVQLGTINRSESTSSAKRAGSH